MSDAEIPDDFEAGRERPPGHRARPLGRRPRESVADPEVRERHAAYWRRNLRYLVVLLGVWFLVSFGFGVVLADPLNALTLPGTGFPLGFWFAQQGSIYVFVVLIFVYVWLMNRLDRDFDVDEGSA